GGGSVTRRLLDRGLRELFRISGRRRRPARALGRIRRPEQPRAPLPVAEVHLEEGAVESARPARRRKAQHDKWHERDQPDAAEGRGGVQKAWGARRPQGEGGRSL